MASIARQNGMHVVVALQILTHSVGNVFPYVYPEFMLPGKKWREGVTYTAHSDYVQYSGKTYKCISTHRAVPGNEPRTGSSHWAAESTNTRDPFNREGEAVVFKMIDELVDAFTVSGVVPEGFHIGCDEVGWWYDDPEQEKGMTSAQIYAMAVNNAYNHIKAKYPDMEVIMWSDMLDPKWNGMPKSARQNLSGRDTAAAIDFIPKDIIIADWRYQAHKRYRHDEVRGLFPSVGEFLDKGFRVWPTSWNEVEGTIDIVWTGNWEQLRTGRVIGHLYSTWLTGMVPELNLLLADPGYQVPDSILSGLNNNDQSKYRKYYRDIADSINATSQLIGIKQCRGTDYYCGDYPRCEDITRNSGYYENLFREYRCKDNKSTSNMLLFPDDHAGHWKFDGNASEAAGRNNGELMKGAVIVKDDERDLVVQFDGFGHHVKVKNNETLKIGPGSLSVAVWFKVKIDASSRLGTILSKDPNYTSYNLFIHDDGRVFFKINGNNYYRYSASGVSCRDGKWHHVTAVFDRTVPTINMYIDGDLSNGSYIFDTPGSDRASTADLIIGSNNDFGQYGFPGLVDDVMIFNRVLSPGEVKMIYQTQKKKPLFEITARK
jgi:hypothetical protein